MNSSIPTKTCSVSGAQYQEGSFSDLVHRYIDSSPEGFSDILTELFSQQRATELLFWRDGVLSEFVPHFKEKFLKLSKDSDDWGFEEGKWNKLASGLAIFFKVYTYSEKIYKGLYSLYCELQKSMGRIHKGTPLHQIGWLDLIKGSPETLKRSQYYMKLAMIEDVLTKGDEYKSLPAFKVLKHEHNLSESNLERLATWTKSQNTEPTEQRPELLFLRYVTDRSNRERSSMYEIDTKLTVELLEGVRKAQGSKEKGDSLELLMAYLFLSSPFFEVIKNIAGPDAETDLIIRNNNFGDAVFGEIGRYILVECRNKTDKVDAKALRDFGGKVIQSSCNSGILVSLSGITGQGDGIGADRTILKFQQRHGVTIVPISVDEIEKGVKEEIPIADLLISEYERIRFDIN